MNGIMNATLLTWYQALQLLALGPCLFMVFFLYAAGRRSGQIAVPLLYFLSLACSFTLPLRELLGFPEWTRTVLLLASAAGPAISFLLIVQFMTGEFPKGWYWTILAVPLVGESQFIYATVVTDAEVCIFEHLCATPALLRKLYDIFTISLTCLLTVIIYRRIHKTSVFAPFADTRRKYALVLALVTLNLLLLAIDLTQIAGYADIEHERLAKTIVRIGFIYLVLTSVFRVFDRSVELDYARVPSIRPAGPSERDLAVKARICEALQDKKLYRDMELSREKLARALAVSEAALSRAVNQCFGENVSMLINRYRVEEAKLRLTEETVPITVIAFEVGFSSIPSFNRVFRQFCAMSPSQWRGRASGG